MDIIRIDEKQKKNNDLYVVGIGASAGGLEALQLLFDNMPSDTGMAFIIVQHLSPDFKSLMPELLAKHLALSITSFSTVRVSLVVIIRVFLLNTYFI